MAVDTFDASTASETQTSAASDLTRHPLDPLGAGEIEQVVSILRTSGFLPPTARFVSIALREPVKAAVLGHETGRPLDRQAEVIVLDRASGTTYEGLVSLTRREVYSWRDVPGVQRAITDMDLVLVDPWSAGFYGDDSERGRRLVRALAWVRTSPGGNAYAHPVENVAIIVDLNAQEVVRVEDYGVVPVPETPGEYAADLTGPKRDDLRPIEIQQPEGTSFSVDGNEVRWQKWHLRIGFTP